MGRTGLERVKKGIFAPDWTGNPFSLPLFGAKKKIGRESGAKGNEEAEWLTP